MLLPTVSLSLVFDLAAEKKNDLFNLSIIHLFSNNTKALFSHIFRGLQWDLTQVCARYFLFSIMSFLWMGDFIVNARNEALAFSFAKYKSLMLRWMAVSFPWNAAFISVATEHVPRESLQYYIYWLISGPESKWARSHMCCRSVLPSWIK